MNKFNKCSTKEKYFIISTIIFLVYFISFSYYILFKEDKIFKDQNRIYKAIRNTLFFNFSRINIKLIILIIDITYKVDLFSFKKELEELISLYNVSKIFYIICVIFKLVILFFNKDNIIEKFSKSLSDEKYQSITDTNITALIRKTIFSNIAYYVITFIVLVNIYIYIFIFLIFIYIQIYINIYFLNI